MKLNNVGKLIFCFPFTKASIIQKTTLIIKVASLYSFMKSLGANMVKLETEKKKIACIHYYSVFLLPKAVM